MVFSLILQAGVGFSSFDITRFVLGCVRKTSQHFSHKRTEQTTLGPRKAEVGGLQREFCRANEQEKYLRINPRGFPTAPSLLMMMDKKLHPVVKPNPIVFFCGGQFFINGSKGGFYYTVFFMGRFCQKKRTAGFCFSNSDAVWCIKEGNPFDDWSWRYEHQEKNERTYPA